MGPRIGADVGGTFTDIVIESAGSRHSAKVLTTHDAPERGILDGISRVADEAGVDLRTVDRIIHGTTLATNALIERRGARTALLTTEGHRDSLEMAYEHRFEQYDINIDRPKPLVSRWLRLRCRLAGLHHLGDGFLELAFRIQEKLSRGNHDISCHKPGQNFNEAAFTLNAHPNVARFKLALTTIDKSHLAPAGVDESFSWNQHGIVFEHSL